MDRSNSGHGLPSYRKSACVGTLLLLLPLLAFFARPAQAQDASTNEVVIFVLDLSGSMNEPFDAEQTKLEAAKDAFTEAFANVSPDARVGLRTYGDQLEPTTPAGREPSCTTDTRVASPVAPLQRDELIAQVQGFSALGDTPMGLAIAQAASDIPAGSTGTIVLFSDGRDECFDADLDGDPATGPSFGEDPCEIAKSVTDGDAVVDRIMTVGFSADQAAETELRCIAESTGGTYTAIQTPEDARDVLPELLVQLSAPREAQRLIGRQIQGATSTDEAPDFVRLDEVGANKVLYTDSIDMNSVRIYRMPEYGPEGGTFTATVFGLPPELGIALDMRIYVPQLDQRFFQGEHGDFDAGLPERPTASIRCTDCSITGGPHEAFFVVTLDSENTALEGTYELELLTEGPGFGGTTTSCSAPQECFYPQEIINLAGELEQIRSSITGDVGELAPAELIAERDQLRIDTNDEQEAVEAANARAQELEERIPLAPRPTTSFRLPLLMILAAIGLALAPVQKLRRKKPDTEEDDGPVDPDENQPTGKKRGRKKKDDEVEAESVALSQSSTGERTLPSLDDVGPPPAVSPNLKSDGNSWDAELEAAKAALAEQRPERPIAPEHASIPLATRNPGAPSLSDLAPPSPATAAPPTAPEPIAPAAPPQAAAHVPPSAAAPISAPPDRRDFTPEEHAAAKLAAEKIAAHLAMEQAASEAASLPPQPTTTPPHAPAIEATRQAAAEQIAAEKAAAEEIARQAVERAAAQQAAADALARDTAEKAAHAAAAASPERAAAEAAASRANEAKQAAAAAVARAEAERVIAQKAAQEAAEKALAEKAAAEKAAAERAAAEKAAAEKAAREAAERAAAEKAATDKIVAERAAAEKAAAEQAAREAAEKAAAQKAAAEQAAADRAAAEELARKAAEQAAAEKAAREAAEQAAAEKAAREAAERAAAEKAAAEQAAREAAEQAAAEKAAAERAAAEREAAEKAAREAAERAAAEKAAREAAERAAAEKAAAAQAAREAAERAAAEKAAREAAERAAAEKAAREAAERAAAEKAAAERAAAEKAAREAAERLAAEKAATERAAAQKAAAEAAARAAAEKAAADRAAAEKAAAERAAAEKATAEAAQRLAAEKAAAVQAANELAAAERAAAEAAAQRAVAEEAAARAAKKRAEQEAAAQAIASTVQSAPAAPAPAASSASAAPMTEEERRQEARRRMLAKQNIVASSSSAGSTSSAPTNTAGTAAALRPMTVPPQSTTPQAPVQSSTPDAPGWYEDPAIVGQFRWWDGATWTGFTAETAQEPPPS